MNPLEKKLVGELRKKVILGKQAPEFSVNVKSEFLEGLLAIITRLDAQVHTMDAKLVQCMDYLDDDGMRKIFVEPLFGDNDGEPK